MYTLTTSEKAPLLDDHDTPVESATTVSSDTEVATISNEGGVTFVVAVGPGTATISATRWSDNATASLEVEVVNETSFQIKLGTPVPK